MDLSKWGKTKWFKLEWEREGFSEEDKEKD